MAQLHHRRLAHHHRRHHDVVGLAQLSTILLFLDRSREGNNRASARGGRRHERRQSHERWRQLQVACPPRRAAGQEAVARRRHGLRAVDPLLRLHVLRAHDRQRARLQDVESPAHDRTRVHGSMHRHDRGRLSRRQAAPKMAIRRRTIHPLSPRLRGITRHPTSPLPRSDLRLPLRHPPRP